jgi:hypothetical protein
MKTRTISLATAVVCLLVIGATLRVAWKMANLHVTFSELVGYAQGHPYARTGFPADWTRGQLTELIGKCFLRVRMYSALRG